MLLHPQFDPVAFSLGPLSVRWYGLMYLVAFVQFILLGRYRIRTRPGFITAAILGFAHTVGEFGVVLMIGGNIPEKTRVVSVQIYDHVEAMEYAEAHMLAGGMLLFGFLVLLALYSRKGAVSWK
mgnify:CR=1 FL=1